VFFCLGVNLVFSQQKEYLIESLTIEDGLSQNEVTSIIQDKYGFIWLGTRGGLNRYDGYEFIHHKPKANEKHLISNPSIETVFEDSKGNLWIGTKSGGLNHYNTKKEKFSHITSFGSPLNPIKDNRVICIAEAKNGNILLGTWSNGMYVLDIKNNKMSQMFENKQINDILVNEDKVWVASNIALYSWQIETNKIELTNLGEGQRNVTEIVIDKAKNTLWLVGWDCGLIAYDIKNKSYINHRIEKDDKLFSSYPNDTYSLLKDKTGMLWIGTWNNGLYNFDIKKSEFTKVELKSSKGRSHSNEYNIILDIFEDNNGGIWIGTDAEGVVKINTNKYFNFISEEENPECGLINFHIISFWESEEGVLYVGTRSGGLYRSFDKEIFELVSLDENIQKPNGITNIYPISENTLWASSLLNYQLDLNETQPLMKGVEDNSINLVRKTTAILQSGNSLLMGTQADGLYYFSDFEKGSDFISYTPENNTVLKNDRITFLREDSNNRIWMGTFNGVYFFDKGNAEIFPLELKEDHYLTGNIINCWHQTSDTVFWIGTPSGLNKLTLESNGKYAVKNYYSELGLIDDYIQGILSANDNEIWVSTNSGIVKLNVNDESIYTFDKSDGLPSLNFSESQGYIGKDGTMYFGTTKGFIYFKSEDVLINKEIPPVMFTKFKIHNTEIKPDDLYNDKIFLEESVTNGPRIQLSHREKEFTIEFAALNYNSPKRNRYSYKLEGYDTEWVLAGDKRAVTYINLKSGEYEFKVRGSNNNNVWNMDGVSLPIVINPAPWETWYAIMFYVVLILGLVLLLRWNAIEQTRLTDSLELEKVQNKQDHRINDMKLRFFTNVSHEFRTPLTLILGPSQEMLKEDHTDRRAQMVYKNANRLMSLVNQLLEFRRVETDTLKLKASENNIEDFVKEVSLSFEELAKLNQIIFSVKSEIIQKDLWFDIEKMEIILNNLISNAFKYSGSKSEIGILITENKKWVQIHITDNGPGINAGDIGKIFERFYQSDKNTASGTGIGLNLVKHMVELHKGEVSVTSKPNIKTEFVVRIQKGDKHLSDFEKTGNRKIERFPIRKNEIVTKSFSAAKMDAFDKKQSILVVEDNHEIREYLFQFLSKDYKVSVAENGEVGYGMAIKEEFDLIISDVLMPIMDGMELCEKLKTNIETSHVPVILLTAKSASQFRLEGFSHGAEAYVSKPFNPEVLKSQILTILLARQKIKRKFGKTITLEATELEITSKEEIFIGSVIKYIEKNISNSEFTSEELAKLTSTSTTTLYRKLKSLTGQSSNEIIRSIRLKRAAQLLKESQDTISEIAYSVGFNDVKYFRKCFQKQFNMTPSNFRKVKHNK
jgi:signal transduction histidine kinase/DNA-binding response OmpR family regulator/ligand-binding sensor domain-containing protein